MNLLLIFEVVLSGVLAYHYYIDNPNKEYIPRSIYERTKNPVDITRDFQTIT